MKELAPHDSSALAQNDNKEGWYMPLSVGAQGKFREYVSAKPAIVNGRLFIATFIQKATNPDEMDICNAVRTLYGESRLYALDMKTGAANLWANPKDGRRMKYAAFAGIKLTGITRARIGGKDSLLLTADSLSGQFDPTKTGQKNVKTVNGVGSLLEVELPAGGGNVGLGEGESLILHWIAK
jgi:Tfp pilus tip-associated adhesin PilY1